VVDACCPPRDPCIKLKPLFAVTELPVQKKGEEEKKRNCKYEKVKMPFQEANLAF
jgi:hypothetical protein